MITIGYHRLPHSEGLQLPAYESEGASGMDLVAALPAAEEVVLAPGSRALIATGMALELPKGFEAQIRPRSGLALKDGVTVLNSPGQSTLIIAAKLGSYSSILGTSPLSFGVVCE